MPRINTNVTALAAQRILNSATKNFGRTAIRLASGFRINRAADDAAGLGIANRLRANIGALRQASRNAEQANSLLQVAEGGAQQVEGILERMSALAAQASSDNVNSTDRGLIQTEFGELQAELDRIVDTTVFQGNNLLDGTFGTSSTLETGTADDLVDAVSGLEFDLTGSFAANTTFTISNVANALTVTNDTTAEVQTLTFTDSTAQTLDFDAHGFKLRLDTSVTDATIDTAIAAGDDKIDIVVANTGGDFVVSASGNIANDTISLAAIDLQGSSLSVDSAAINVTTKSAAQASVTAINSAIDTVSAAFGDIGAAQNRIDFAAANTATQTENFQAAESVIRDADIAAEATEFAKAQIKQQAATAILAQANAAPQLVLQLIQ